MCGLKFSRITGLHFLSVNLTPHGPPVRNVTVQKRGKKGLFKCCNNVTQWGYQIFLQKSVTKVYGPMLLVLGGGEWGSHFPGKSVT